MYAPQYHWNATAAKSAPVVDQEARERIVSIANLLDRFGHQTICREEELWARSERETEGSQVVRLVEPLDERMKQLEQRVTEVETQSVVDQLNLTKEREYVDTHFSQMDATLTNLARRLHIVEEITKNWNKLQQENVM